MAPGGSRHMVKQSLRFSLINYAGIGIGILASLYLYPRDRELYGTFSYIQAGAELLMPLMGFGISQAIIKYFPRVRDQADNRNRLFGFSLSFVLVSALLIGSLALLMRPLFPAISAYIRVDYMPYSVLIAIGITSMDLLKKYLSNFKNITAQAFVDSFVLRLGLPILFILVLYYGVKPVFTYRAFSFFYVVVAFFMLRYTLRFTQTRLDFHFKAIRHLIGKPFFQYSLIMLASLIGNKLAFSIDRFMIPNLLSEKDNGTYTIALNLSRSMAVPAAAVIAIASPLITDYLATGNRNGLQRVYKRASLSLSAIGIWLYLAVFLGISFFFESLSTAKNLLPSVPILLVLGIGFVCNMATGINSQIISFSEHYRFTFYLTLFLGMMNIAFNLVFIEVFETGVIGVAYATLTSLVVFNAVVIAFVYRKFGILPFTPSHIKVLILGLLSAAVIYLLPNFKTPGFNALYKPGLFLLTNLSTVHQMNWVADINACTANLVKRFKK
ncbi:MAG: polysaccharide biosynthesis C-terminal domain-containing protein [Flavobacteriales bacterium]